MQIRLVEAFGVRLPMIKPMIMAGVEVHTADNLIVRVVTDTDHEGWGEAASAPTMTGETVESMVAAVRYLTPFLVGKRADDFVGFDRELAARLHGNHAAKSAIDMALLDAVARVRGIAMHEMLGIKLRDSVPVLWLIGTGDTSRDVEEAKAKKAEGVTAYKIKIGLRGAGEDASRTAAICDVLGEGMLVSADANQGYSVEEALTYVRALEESALNFLEQPIASDDIDGMAHIAATTCIAIGADEGIHSLRDLQMHHDLGAAQGVSLKTIKLGGPRAVQRAANLCDRLGMRVNLACKIAESSIGSAAILQLASVIPSVQWGVSLSSQYLRDDLVDMPISIAGGIAHHPQGPGLGVEVDIERVREFQF